MTLNLKHIRFSSQKWLVGVPVLHSTTEIHLDLAGVNVKPSLYMYNCVVISNKNVFVLVKSCRYLLHQPRPLL